MAKWISNARMYSVTPAIETVWRDLLGKIASAADVDLEYIHYPAPQPLETLWARPDLGSVFMCGYPIALGLADIRPIAAPIPAATWAGGKPLYRSDLIVRSDAPFLTLEDTFGLKTGWTVQHSHSGFNAWRHHLLRYRTAARPTLYGSVLPNMVTARNVLDAVRDGTIDIGPLDAYWHTLIAHHAPELVKGTRVLHSTDLAPIPAFVAAPGLPEAAFLRLQQSFLAAHDAPWFQAYAVPLALQGFAAVGIADFQTTLDWDRRAKAEGYMFPA